MTNEFRCLVFAVITGFLALLAQAYSGGSGTETDPYQIANKADLLYLGTNTTDYSKHFIMTADVDLVGEVFNRAMVAPDLSSAWLLQGTAFTGVFDGGGCVISNLLIDSTSEGSDYIGLFGYNRGVICDLSVVNINMIGGYLQANYTGGMCGYNDCGVISNCFVQGVLESSSASMTPFEKVFERQGLGS